MKDKVRIKSFSKGLNIILDEEASFDELLKETAAKFSDGKAFFGNAAVAVSFQGKELSDSEQVQILDCIRYNCNLKVVCVICKDEAQDRMFGKAIQHYETQKLLESEIEKTIQVFQGSLQDGEELETPNSIVIFGDVEAGCSVASDKNILVLGALRGRAHAGKGTDSKEHIVAALEMTPEDLTIGDFKYIPPKKGMWGKKKKDTPLTARVQENSILMEEFTKEHLKDF